VQAGSYLAAAGDCVSCHTRPGGKAFAGGLALDTPFGVIYSANITPDAQTGIGRWSEQQFTRAMREGTGADGRRLYPAFPYGAYTKLSDQDVRALYAYLRSLQPVKDRPPANQLRFPFGFRALLAPWNWLYFTPGRFVAAASRSAQWNRGAYLTEALGHCSACHSPRTMLGGERTALAYTGGEYLDEVRTEVVDGRITPLEERTVRLWSTANLTSAAEGIGA
jgi:nicotinate dehydrogenase subunit B